MLELTRCTGQSFRIGDDIVIRVAVTPTKQVLLTTTAPKDVKIHREEIYKRIHDNYN